MPNDALAGAVPYLFYRARHAQSLKALPPIVPDIGLLFYKVFRVFNAIGYNPRVSALFASL